MTIPHDLLNDLRSSATDLARIVEAVFRDGLPYVMIPSQAASDPGSAHRAYRGLGFGRRSEGEDAAECGDHQRFADVRAGSEDHDGFCAHGFSPAP